MTARVATFYKRRYSSYVPAMGFAHDVVEAGSYVVNFGNPAAASAAAILSAQSIASATDTVTAAVALLDDQSDANFGQNITVVASGAATSTVTVTGRDYLGQPMVETMTLNGATPVLGLKAFYWLDKIAWGATGGTTINVGWGSKLGLPYRMAAFTAEIIDGVQDATAGTFVAGSLTDPQTATTGDPRGTYVPHTTANGTKNIRGRFIPYNVVNSSGNGGLHGIAHYYA